MKQQPDWFGAAEPPEPAPLEPEDGDAKYVFIDMSRKVVLHNIPIYYVKDFLANCKRNEIHNVGVVRITSNALTIMDLEAFR